MEGDKNGTKRRFQFSLKTLIAIIVGYTVAWGMTISVGTRQVINKEVSQLQGSIENVEEHRGYIIVTWIDDQKNTWVYKGNHVCPCPFFIKWNWEIVRKSNLVLEKQYYLWLVGPKCIYSEEYSSPRKK